MLMVVRAWVLLSALLCGAGWILSAFHALNRAGYLVVFTLAAIAVGWWRLSAKWPSRKTIHRPWHKLSHRFKRAAPLAFLVLALMTFVAGSLYIPNNGDSNGYRIPRVLHWLGQEQWHWIHTGDARMNSAACGFEWLSAPLILFTRTDRFLFLINWVPYLMLPGLTFSIFRRLGVRPRVAWWWMWLLASGWCFALQAGSTGNDVLGAVFGLAAVDLALRAVENKKTGDLWLSLLAVAFMTGVKQTNLPLVLLWLLAAWPAWRLLLARPLAAAAVVVVSLLISAAPTTCFNLQHCGNWMGFSQNDIYNPVWARCQTGSALWGIVGNTFCITTQNLTLPFIPKVGVWNAAMENFLQTPFGAHFAAFERFGHLEHINECVAGLGPAICCFTLVSLVWGCRRRGNKPVAGAGFSVKLLRWTPWMLLLVFMAKVGAFAEARLLTPYYAFLFPSLLACPRQSDLVRRTWWRRSGLLVMVSAVLLVFSLRDRPLFPAQPALGWLAKKYPQSKPVSWTTNFYAYAIGPLFARDARDFFAKDLPPDERIIGYATIGGVAEPGLWLPFGQRRVERVLAGDTPEQLHQLGIHYVMVDYLDCRFGKRVI